MKRLLLIVLFISVGLSQEEYDYANIAYSDGRYLLKSGDLVVTMGAGDVGQLAIDLLQSLKTEKVAL